MILNNPVLGCNFYSRGYLHFSSTVKTWRKKLRIIQYTDFFYIILLMMIFWTIYFKKFKFNSGNFDGRNSL